MALTRTQDRRLTNLRELQKSGTALSPEQQSNFDRLKAISSGDDSARLTSGGDTTSGGGGGGNRQINKATNRAEQVMASGTQIGQNLLPEVFEGGSGLDRTGFNAVTADQIAAGSTQFNPVTAGSVAAQQVDFGRQNQFLAPSVGEAQALTGDTRGQFDSLLGMRQGRLGGLDAAENQALKESLFRDINRQRAGAMRDVARTPGLGAGASFAQRRALERDFGNQAVDANRQLLLDNVGIKERALDSLQNTVGARQSMLGSEADRIAALRGLQAQSIANTDQLNSAQDLASQQFNVANTLNADQFSAQGQLASDQANMDRQLLAAQQSAANKLNADQFSSTGQFASDQFNADQQKAELAARTGAVATGAGLTQDERDRIQTKNQRNKYLDFLKEQDERRFSQAQSLFGG